MTMPRKRRNDEDSTDPDDRTPSTSQIIKRVKLNDTYKKSAILALIHLNIDLLRLHGFNWDQRLDISLVDRNMALIATLFQHVRQNLNHPVEPKIGAIEMQGKSGKVSITANTLLHRFNKILALYGLKPEKNAAWIGTMAPLLALGAGFKHRLDEVRFGPTRVPYIDEEGKNKFRQATGFPKDLQSIYSMSNFPPTMKSALAQSLPVGTLILQYKNSQGTIYDAKWKAAIMECIKNVPHASSIMSFIESRRGSELDQVLWALGNYSKLGFLRTRNRAFFPFSFYLEYANKQAKAAIEKIFIPASAAEGSSVDGGVTGYGWPADPITTDVAFTFDITIDYSGKQMWLFYKEMAGVQFTIRCNQTPSDIQQLMVHGIFGTDKEDLGLVSKMFGHKFKVRKDFVGLKWQGDDIKFSLMMPKLVSKLASGSVSHQIQGTSSQVSATPIFAGTFNRYYTSAFLSSLGVAESSRSAGTLMKYVDWVQWYQKSMSDEKYRLEKQGNSYSRGTTKFYTFDTITKESWGEEREIVCSLQPYFFAGDDLET